jgi:hypothetical protein
MVVLAFLRRPLGLFAAIVVVGLIVIAVGMTAFGGTSGGSSYSVTALSPAQFARAGEHACLSLRRQLKPVVGKERRSLRARAQSIRLITATFDRLTADLYGVVAPASDAASFRRLLASLKAADLGLHRLDHFAGTGQWQSAAVFVRSTEWKDIGKQLGPPAKRVDLRCNGARRTSAVLRAVRARASSGTSAATQYSATPLTPAQFARLGERVCVYLRGRLGPVVAQKPESQTEAAQLIGRLTSIVDGVITQLNGVVPPPSAAAPFRRLLGNLEAADGGLHRLNELTETGQWQRAALLVRSEWWKELGQRLGPEVAPGDMRCG